VIMMGSPSGSNEPESMEAWATQSLAVMASTFVQRATGGWLSGSTVKSTFELVRTPKGLLTVAE